MSAQSYKLGKTLKEVADKAHLAQPDPDVFTRFYSTQPAVNTQQKKTILDVLENWPYSQLKPVKRPTVKPFTR